MLYWVGISKQEPLSARIIAISSWEENVVRDEESFEWLLVDYFEDVERELYNKGVPFPPDFKKPRPVKSLYAGYSECDEGHDDVDFAVWADSKSQVIEWLRQTHDPEQYYRRDWWSKFERQVEDDYPDIKTMHPFDVLRIMEDETNINGDSEHAFRIVQVPAREIIDVRPLVTKKRKRAT